MGGGFGSQDLHLRRGVRRPLGVARGRRPAGEVDRRAQRGVPHRRARPRPRHPRRAGARRRTATSWRCGSTRRPTSAPTCRPSLLRSRPTSTPRCWPASTRRRRSTPTCRPTTPTPRRSTPIAAPAGPRRRSCSRAWSTRRRASSGWTRPSSAGRTSSRRTPSRTRRRWRCMYDIGQLRGDARRGAQARRLRRASRRARPKPSGAASCAASASPATSRPAASHPRRWSARSAPASACGRVRKVRFTHTGKVQVLTGTHSHGQGHETTFAQVVAEQARRAVRGRRGHPRRHRQDARSAWAPTARARWRSAARRIVKACDKIVDQGQEDRRPPDGGGRGRHRVQGRQVHGRRHRQGGADRRRWRSPPTCRTTTRRALEPGLEETAFFDPPNFTYPAGTHICELEVDPDTGVVEILQLRRGRRFRQRRQPDDRRGPGPWRPRPGHRPGADGERAVYDESGQLLTGSYMDYAMPRARQRADLRGRDLRRHRLHVTTRWA